MTDQKPSPVVRVIEAVLIAGLSALATKLVERLFREKEKDDQASKSTSAGSSSSS